MHRILALVILMVLSVSAFAGDDGCCDFESGASAVYTASHDNSDQNSSSSPECECSYCLNCFRCGNLASVESSSPNIRKNIADSEVYGFYISPYAPTPYLSGLKRPPKI